MNHKNKIKYHQLNENYDFLDLKNVLLFVQVIS